MLRVCIAAVVCVCVCVCVYVIICYTERPEISMKCRVLVVETVLCLKPMCNSQQCRRQLKLKDSCK